LIFFSDEREETGPGDFLDVFQLRECSQFETPSSKRTLVYVDIKKPKKQTKKKKKKKTQNEPAQLGRKETLFLRFSRRKFKLSGQEMQTFI
jgi:hypothetical protein